MSSNTRDGADTGLKRTRMLASVVLILMITLLLLFGLVLRNPDNVQVEVLEGLTHNSAAGATSGEFETWVLVQNPDQKNPAYVNITYMTPDGPVAGPSELLQPGARKSFNVAESVPDTWEVSTQVSSNQNVIAERAMYGEDRRWGHDSRAGKL